MYLCSMCIYIICMYPRSQTTVFNKVVVTTTISSKPPFPIVGSVQPHSLSSIFSVAKPSSAISTAHEPWFHKKMLDKSPWMPNLKDVYIIPKWASILKLLHSI